MTQTVEASDNGTVLATGGGTVHGTCHHDCPDSCGWLVTVEQGEAVRMRGNPAHPFSRGELCPKVNRYLDRVYSPERVLHPLRRVGAKGEGRFQQISWDDALGEIAQRWHDVIATDGPTAILPFVSAGNQGLLALHFGGRFWNRMGSARTIGALCGAVAGAGAATTNGTGQALDPSEMVHSKLIVLWGTNTRLTNRHLWPFVEEARDQGAQVVVIDPVRTITADSADWFLQPRPGTDVALMLAMMHVLIRDGLTDDEWIAAHTEGYDDLAAHVGEWTPARAAQITGISAPDIERLATIYGTVRPAALRTLIGAEHHEHGGMFFRTLACLPALVGAWRDRGGGFSRSVGSWSSAIIDEAALERPDLHLGGEKRDVWMPQLGRVLDDRVQPIRALLIQAANAMVSVPNTELVRRGLMRDDLFTVAHEQYITDAVRYADIVLPATTHIEAFDVVPAWGHLNLGWNEPAIVPRGEAVSNSELYRRLARAMGYTEPELYDDDLTVLAAGLPTIDLAQLRANGFVRVPYPADGRPYAEGGFPTASGKVQLRCDPAAADGVHALPTYVAPSALDHPTHPFVVLAVKHHPRFLNSSYSHLPRHAAGEGAPFVEMVGADAQRLGLADGQQARVWNERGALELPVRISERLRPGVVAVPWGWWAAAHADGKVANSLTSDELTDWGGGVAYLDTAVSIAPA